MSLGCPAAVWSMPELKYFIASFIVRWIHHWWLQAALVLRGVSSSAPSPPRVRSPLEKPRGHGRNRREGPRNTPGKTIASRLCCGLTNLLPALPSCGRAADETLQGQVVGPRVPSPGGGARPILLLSESCTHTCDRARCDRVTLLCRERIT